MSAAQQTGNRKDRDKYTRNPEFNSNIREDEPGGKIEIIGLEDEDYESQDEVYDGHEINLGGTVGKWSPVIRKLENENDNEDEKAEDEKGNQGYVPEGTPNKHEKHVREWNTENPVKDYLIDKLSIL